GEEGLPRRLHHRPHLQDHHRGAAAPARRGPRHPRGDGADHRQVPGQAARPALPDRPRAGRGPAGLEPAGVVTHAQADGAGHRAGILAAAVRGRLAAGLVLLVGAAAVGGWYFFIHKPATTADAGRAATAPPAPAAATLPPVTAAPAAAVPSAAPPINPAPSAAPVTAPPAAP